MFRKRVVNRVRWPVTLAAKASFGGIHITDLILIAAVAFVISRVTDGIKVEITYSLIGGICVPLYLFLIGKNRFLPKCFFLFLFRKLFGGQKREIYFNQRYKKWE